MNNINDKFLLVFLIIIYSFLSFISFDTRSEIIFWPLFVSVCLIFTKVTYKKQLTLLIRDLAISERVQIIILGGFISIPTSFDNIPQLLLRWFAFSLSLILWSSIAIGRKNK